MEKKPKSITIRQFDYIIRNVNDEELDLQGHLNQFTEYDSEGRTLKEIKYNREGEFEDMLEYGYDNKGNLVRESYYPAENEMAEEKTFLWNDAGMIISGLKHYQDGSVDTISFEYNETGNLIKRTIITDEDEVEQVETFEWENGELISHEIFDEHGDPVEIQEAPAAKSSQTRITQNEKGQVVTEEELDENEEVFMTIRRMYDDDGQPEEVEVFIDGRGQAISRHYFLKYEYTFFE